VLLAGATITITSCLKASLCQTLTTKLKTSSYIIPGRLHLFITNVQHIPSQLHISEKYPSLFKKIIPKRHLSKSDFVCFVKQKKGSLRIRYVLGFLEALQIFWVLKTLKPLKFLQSKKTALRQIVYLSISINTNKGKLLKTFSFITIKPKINLFYLYIIRGD
jgi:hypothetical protein